MIQVQAFRKATVGGVKTLELCYPEDKVYCWRITYPGQKHPSLHLELIEGALSSYTVDNIIKALKSSFEAGRQAAFAEVCDLLGAQRK